MENEWISVKQLVKQYNISKSLAYKLIAKGEIPSTKLGGKRIIINKNEFDKFLNKQA